MSEATRDTEQGELGETGAGPATIGTLLAADLLDVNGRPLTGRDLLAAGIVAGRWQQLEGELGQGVGLLAADPVAKTEIAAQMRTLRFERGLLSADDVRAWMAPRGLSIGAVNAVAARMVARRRGGAVAAADPAEVAASLPAEAICRGVLAEIGGWLADRLLSAHASGAEVTPLPLESLRVQRLVWDEARSVAGRTSSEPAVVRAERIAGIAALDDAHRDWQASVSGEASVSRRLREHELDWCRYELEELRAAHPGAAAEIARQLAEAADARTLAAAAGVPLNVYRLILADASEAVVRALTGAVAGEVAGPWQDGEDHVVVRVRERVAPSPADGELVARAEAELIAEASGRLRVGRVRWHDRI